MKHKKVTNKQIMAAYRQSYSLMQEAKRHDDNFKTNSMNIDAMEVKFQLRGLLMKWFKEGKESHGKMAIPIYPSSMINRDVDSFLEQFKSEQKQSVGVNLSPDTPATPLEA